MKSYLSVAPIIYLLASQALADVGHNADFPVSDLSIEAVLEPADSNVYHHINVAQCMFKTEAIGKPEIPYQTINFVIPTNEEVTGITINDTIKQEIGDTFYVYPAQPPWKIGDPQPEFVPPDSEAYSSNLPYPGRLAEMVQTAYLSGYHIVTVRLYPVQYIPAERRLIFYSKIVFTVHTRASVSKAVPVYRRSPIIQARMEKLVRSLVENPGSVGRNAKGVEQKKVEPLVITGLPSIEGNGVDYLIITNEALKSAFQLLADWKTKKGIITQIRTIEWIAANYGGCDHQEKIRNFIRDAYSYWGVGYVLMAGDTRIIPERRVAWRKAEGWIPSDLYYSGLEGNWNANANYLFGELDIYGNNVDSADIFPDLAVGRASVETLEEANTFINKVLAYEQNPSTEYLTKMLFLAAGEKWWQGTQPPQWAEQAQWPFPDSILGTGFPEWFKENKYELYAPVVDTNQNHIPPWWEGDSFLCKDKVVSAMNNGYHLIWHTDHCSQYSIGTGREHNTDPQRLLFRNDAMALSNYNKPSILWTEGCDPNAFDYESISEALMNNPNGGTVAFMGNSVHGLFDDIWKGNWIFRSLFHYNIFNIGDAFKSVQGVDYDYFA